MYSNYLLDLLEPLDVALPRLELPVLPLLILLPDDLGGALRMVPLELVGLCCVGLAAGRCAGLLCWLMFPVGLCCVGLLTWPVLVFLPRCGTTLPVFVLPGWLVIAPLSLAGRLLPPLTREETPVILPFTSRITAVFPLWLTRVAPVTPTLGVLR